MLDARRIASYLAVQGIDATELTACRPLEGGQSNPTWLIETRARKYVLRAKPHGNLLKSAHAIDREYRVLRALHGSAVPVPRAYAYCDDASVLDVPFYVMDFVDGRTFWEPEIPGVSNDERARIYDSMNRVLVALARLDLEATHLTDFGKRSGFFERQVRRWTEQYRAAETGRRPDVEVLIDWLPRNLPRDDGAVALMHGDFRLDNLRIDDSGRVAAVIDWELSTLGHPFSDIAYQCAQWRLPQGRMRGLGGIDRESIGIPGEAAYVERFCVALGVDMPRDWTFHLTLSLFRLASICQGVYRRGLDGNAASSSALDFDERTNIIASHAAAIVERDAKSPSSIGRLS